MATTTSDAKHAATRRRSTGTSRRESAKSLLEAGMSSQDAYEVIDEIDSKLGFEGRTLPDDASDLVKQQVAAHREAQRSANAATATDAVPTIAELAAGRVPKARPMIRARTGPETSPQNEDALSRSTRSALTEKANRLANSAHSEVRIKNWLVNEGMTPDEALTVARSATRDAAAFRKSMLEKQSAGKLIAVLEVIVGIVLLILGLAAGWFVGLFLVPIAHGCKRLLD